MPKKNITQKENIQSKRIKSKRRGRHTRPPPNHQKTL